jgi:RNA polymerase sigma-70 factor (ECF subfamily)
MGMQLQLLQKLWEDHSRVIYGYLLKLSKDPDFAADLLQDLFCRLGQNDELLGRMGDQPRGFLLRLAYNSLVDKVRRDEARERVFAKMGIDGSEPSVGAADPDMSELERALRAALEQLPEEQRVVVMARYLGRQTFEEIAAAHGISINTAASRFRYGVDKMRGELRVLYESLNGRETRQTDKTMKESNWFQSEQDLADDPLIRPLEARRVPSASVLSWLEMVPGTDLAEPELENVPFDGTDVEGAEEPAPELSNEEAMVILDERAWDGTWDEAEPPMGFEDIAKHVLRAEDAREMGDPAGFLGWLLEQSEAQDPDGVGGQGGADGDSALPTGSEAVLGPVEDPEEQAGAGSDPGGLRVGLVRQPGILRPMSGLALSVAGGTGPDVAGNRVMAASVARALKSVAMLSLNGVVAGEDPVLGEAVVVQETEARQAMDIDGQSIAVGNQGDLHNVDLEATVFGEPQTQWVEERAEGIERASADVAAQGADRMQSEAMYITSVSGRPGVGVVPGAGAPLFREEPVEVAPSDLKQALDRLQADVNNPVVVDVDTVLGELEIRNRPEFNPVPPDVRFEVAEVRGSEILGVQHDTRLDVDSGVQIGNPQMETADSGDLQNGDLLRAAAGVEWIQPSADVMAQLPAPEDDSLELFSAPLKEQEAQAQSDTGWATVGAAGATTALGMTGRSDKREEK